VWENVVDQKILRQQLKNADARLAERQKEIDKLRAQIAESVSGGQEIEKLRDALERLELAQTLYQAHRDQLAATIK